MSSVPYDYYPAVLYALDKISQGRSKTAACDEANIGIQVFEEYVRRDNHLQALYVDAERRGYDALADALLTPGDAKNTLLNHTNPQMIKVVSDNIKWVLSKRDQKRFGEKIEIKHEITLDRAITDAMAAAKQRAMSRSVDLPKSEYVSLPAPPPTDAGEIIDVLTEDDELLAELLA